MAEGGGMKGKAKIIKVGGFISTCFGPMPVGWHFDCAGVVAGYDIGDDALRLGGWTIEELQEIAQRPAEFVEIP